VDPELQRILIRVALVGGGIMVIGAGVLIVAFRSFSTTQGRGRDFRATVLIAAVIAFVMICCLVLFRLSRVQ
jgi:hypothetical protein